MKEGIRTKVPAYDSTERSLNSGKVEWRAPTWRPRKPLRTNESDILFRLCHLVKERRTVGDIPTESLGIPWRQAWQNSMTRFYERCYEHFNSPDCSAGHRKQQAVSWASTCFWFPSSSAISSVIWSHQFDPPEFQCPHLSNASILNMTRIIVRNKGDCECKGDLRTSRDCLYTSGQLTLLTLLSFCDL